MRVLLVSTNTCTSMVPPFPVGLAFVAASLSEEGHEVDVWDAMFEEDWPSSLRRRLRGFGPDVVGLSVRNVDDQDFRTPRFLMAEARDMAAVCRNESRAPVVAGGAGFSMFASEALAYLGADYGIVGEGERAFPQLLDTLDSKGAPERVPGLVWRENGVVRKNPFELIADLSALPSPDRRRMDMPQYYEARGTAPIPNVATVQAKRGCTLSCVYCATPAIEGGTIRSRSPDSVADEVEALAEAGHTRIQFVDSVFTNPEQHAEALCREFIRRGLGIQWSCTLNPAFASPDLIRLMKRAGCGLVMVGNESGCDRLLEALRKGFTRADVERCFSLLEAEGVQYNAFLLLGGPGEDRRSLDESIEFMQRWSPSMVSVSVGIRLYPHCDLTRRAREEGVLAASADLLTPRFYLAPAIRNWIFDYLEPIMAERPNWLF